MAGISPRRRTRPKEDTIVCSAVSICVYSLMGCLANYKTEIQMMLLLDFVRVCLLLQLNISSGLYLHCKLDYPLTTQLPVPCQTNQTHNYLYYRWNSFNFKKSYCVIKVLLITTDHFFEMLCCDDLNVSVCPESL